MANIGSFKKVGNDFQGEIITLSLQAKGVRIVAADVGGKVGKLLEMKDKLWTR